MATNTRQPEWMLFYAKAQAQGAFAAPPASDRSQRPGACQAPAQLPRQR
jgi:hypothetical protein